MVDNQAFTFEKAIMRLEVVCKPCTRAMKGTPAASRYHNLWELIWVRDRFVHLLGRVLFDQSSESTRKWSDEALDDFYQLAMLRFPDLSKPIMSVPD